MKYNAVIDIKDVSSGSDEIVEPITVQEVKDYLRLEGFTDTDESTSESLSDFDFDDTLIEEAITAVREMVELKCSLSLIPKTLSTVLTNQVGLIEIPRGPVNSVTSITSEDGDAYDADNIKTVGGDFKLLRCPNDCNMTVVYEAGYTTVPKGIKFDLLRAAAYYYMNRGAEVVNPFVLSLAKKYSRNVWLA